METTRPVPGAVGGTGRVVARLAAFGGVSLVALVVVPVLLYPFFDLASAITGTRLIAYGAMSCVAMLAGTAITVRWFRESWGEATRLGTDAFRIGRLLEGLAAGWFAIVIPVGVMLWLRAVRMEPAEAGDWWGAAGIAVAMLLPSALFEELLFRGYGFTLIQRGWGTAVAVATTSAGFGLLHLFNPGVTVRSLVMVALAGVFLAIVRLAYDSLWAAWLAHFAYNFVQLAVFHTPVSGLALPQPGYRLVSAGPEWLTGGAWGPEAGAAAAAGMLGVTFLMAMRAGWVKIHRRGWRVAIDVRPAGRRET
ncbi:MAG: CPBP family intramembrane glutamic endopeptidase [Gemmatimonadaceae bacterium]